MENWKERTRLMIGDENVEKLSRMHVLQVGIGGVGAYTAEMLCRAGVGELTLVDADTVSISNINRQLPALHSTIGQSKVEVMSQRLYDINPEIKLHCIEAFIRDERTTELLDAAHYDCVSDAIDTLSPKVYLIYQTMQRCIPLVSVMGAGGKMDPTRIQIADISKTTHCHLAKTVRKRLYRMGIKRGFQAIFSTEAVPNEVIVIDKEEEINKLSTVGTISYMPAAFGCAASAAVIRTLLGSE